MLEFGIDLDVWPWIWLSVAVIFALLELTVIGGYFLLLPWAISAFAAALLGFYDVSIEIQWGVFVLGGAVLFLGLYQWSKRFITDNDLDPGVGANRLIGLTGIVTEPINPDDVTRHGRVSVGGEVWAALSRDGSAYAAGDKVRITAVQGTRVVVEPVDTRNHTDQQGDP
jgi:membrane protein implicated in regulation of membrane protease activity